MIARQPNTDIYDTSRPAFVRAYVAGHRAARSGSAATVCPYTPTDRRMNLSKYIVELESYWLAGFRDQLQIIKEK